MKTFTISVLLSLLMACHSEHMTPTAPVKNVQVTGSILKQGTFSGTGHAVSGTAKLYDDGGEKYLLLDPFSTQNGPDLKVYLSKGVDASTYINLGDLMSTMGQQRYTIPNSVDTKAYPYVLIWCEQFSVEFGSAKLN